jgi:phosphoribosylpyrophosphate synthetase
VLVVGNAHPELAREIGRLAGATIISATVSTFGDGETRIRIEADVQ